MSNPSKQKGTGEETRVVNVINERMPAALARRMPASSTFDIHFGVPDGVAGGTCEVLETRADRGGALYTLREEDFLRLVARSGAIGSTSFHVECKRYARFALHTIFAGKFGGTK